MTLRKPLALALVVIAIAIVGVAAYYLYMYMHGTVKQSITIKICNAGSLTIPLQKLATLFKQKYGINVVLEPSGSVEAVRKVTDLGKICDIVAVADYRLLPMFMVPKYADWYIAFASNSIVVAYTNQSKYADQLRGNPLKIFEVLAKPGVRFGFSDPNKDPCGYRAVGVIALASLYTNNLSIVKSLVTSNIPGAKLVEENGVLHVYIPPTIEAKGNLVVRPKSVDLIALLESGALDYAFEYRSVAVQHHLNYVELPSALNLADPKHDSFYSRVVVHILTGTEKEKAIKMASIVYGLTIPKNTAHPREALQFVKFLLSETGREVFQSLGQPFLPKPIGFGNVPQELRSYVELAKS